MSYRATEPCRLRKWYIDNPIVSDAVLHQCATKSRHFFRVIRGGLTGALCGYWNLIPLADEQTFDCFVDQSSKSCFEGQAHSRQHEALLLEHGLRYDELAGKTAHLRNYYLYVAGVVAPERPDLIDVWLQKRRAATLLDLLSFVRRLNRRRTIGGVCAYMATEEGERLAVNWGFKPIKRMDDKHFTYVLKGRQGMAAFFERADRALESSNGSRDVRIALAAVNGKDKDNSAPYIPALRKRLADAPRRCCSRCSLGAAKWRARAACRPLAITARRPLLLSEG
jgi:hypothetical protein